MARTYNNPPLIEAVCQFQFVSSQAWDWTIPGLIYEQIRENFPHKFIYTSSLDLEQPDLDLEYDEWVDMPPRATQKVVMKARFAGRGEPLAIPDEE